MILVSVMYPAGPNFDMGYYLGHHMPLVRERWSALGLHDAKVVKGAGTPDGGAAPFQVMALLTFESADAFKKAVAAHGEEIFADIPNFTTAQAQVQLNDFAESRDRHRQGGAAGRSEPRHLRGRAARRRPALDGPERLTPKRRPGSTRTPPAAASPGCGSCSPLSGSDAGRAGRDRRGLRGCPPARRLRDDLDR